MIKEEHHDVVQLAHQLISLPSITPEDFGCQKIISERLQVLGFQCEPMRFGVVDNLWARYGEAHPLFVFAGHTDVVPTGPESEWISPPFLPEIRNHHLYGRGASDMKGALAAMIIATEYFVKEHPHFKGSIAFLITSDEEGPALEGTRKVVETLQSRGEKMDYCLIGEPSSQDEVGDQIRVGRRGSLHAKLTIMGKQGHVAHPHLAVNPIHTALLALHELVETEWDLGNENFPPTTFQITNIQGGTGATNVIPGKLELLMNFRFSTAVTVADIQKRTEAIFKKQAVKYHIEWQVGGEAFLSRQAKLTSITEKAIAATTGKKTRLTTGGGTSDGRFIAKTGTEVVELGVSHTTAHHLNECVKIADLVTLTEIYQRILVSLFK